jgi:hypothetical protein
MKRAPTAGLSGRGFGFRLDVSIGSQNPEAPRRAKEVQEYRIVTPPKTYSIYLWPYFLSLFNFFASLLHRADRDLFGSCDCPVVSTTEALKVQCKLQKLQCAKAVLHIFSTFVSHLRQKKFYF